MKVLRLNSHFKAIISDSGKCALAPRNNGHCFPDNREAKVSGSLPGGEVTVNGLSSA